MDLLPARNSITGVSLYYINTAVFIGCAIVAWDYHSTLAVIGFIIAFTVLLLQDILWLRRTRFEPRDKYLIEKLKRRFDDKRTHELLTKFDFSKQTYHLVRHLIKLEEIMKWDGVDFEFKNKRCQQAWTGIREHIQALLELLNAHGKPQNGYLYYISHTAQPDYQAENYATQAQQHTREIWRHYQELRRIYIQKMPYE